MSFCQRITRRTRIFIKTTEDTKEHKKNNFVIFVKSVGKRKNFVIFVKSVGKEKNFVIFVLSVGKRKIIR